MKRIILNVALAVLLFVLAPAALFAQDELTLESLAETVAGLTERLEALESSFFPDAITDADGNCQLAVSGGLFSNQTGSMHPSTVAAYMELSDSQVPQHIEIVSVYLVPGVGIAITLKARQPFEAYVIETWSGCEFQKHSRFWEQDYSGNISYLD